MDNDKIQIFEDKKIRTAWNEETEEWYFSVVDVIGVLTEQSTQRGASNYWAKLKERLKKEEVDQQLLSIKARNELTDECDAHGFQKGIEYAEGGYAKQLSVLLGLEG